MGPPIRNKRKSQSTLEKNPTVIKQKCGEEDKNIIVTFLDAYTEKWISKEKKFSVNNNINGSCLRIWRNKVLELVDRKIESGRAKFRKGWSLRIEGDVKRELDRLKNNYVITVTDKAQ